MDRFIAQKPSKQSAESQLGVYYWRKNNEWAIRFEIEFISQSNGKICEFNWRELLIGHDRGLLNKIRGIGA